MFRSSALLSKIMIFFILSAVPLFTYGQQPETNYFARVAGTLGSSRATNNLLAIDDSNGSVVNQRVGRFGQKIWVLDGGNPKIADCLSKGCVVVKNFVNLEKNDSYNYDLEVLTLPEFKVVKTQKVTGTFTKKNDILGVSPKANIALNTVLTCIASSGMGGIGCSYQQHPYFLQSNGEQLISSYSMNDLVFNDRSIVSFSHDEKFIATHHFIDTKKRLSTIKLQRVSSNQNKLEPVRLFPEPILNGNSLACADYPNNGLLFLLSESGDAQIFQTNGGKRIFVGKIAKDFRWIESCKTSISQGKLTLKVRSEGEPNQYFEIKIF